MIILGKNERTKVEEIRNGLPSNVLEVYDNAETFRDGKANKDTLVSVIKQAYKECGNCGCELDSLYKGL